VRQFAFEIWFPYLAGHYAGSTPPKNASLIIDPSVALSFRFHANELMVRELSGQCSIWAFQAMLTSIMPETLRPPPPRELSVYPFRLWPTGTPDVADLRSRGGMGKL